MLRSEKSGSEAASPQASPIQPRPIEAVIEGRGRVWQWGCDLAWEAMVARMQLLMGLCHTPKTETMALTLERWRHFPVDIRQGAEIVVVCWIDGVMMAGPVLMSVRHYEEGMLREVREMEVSKAMGEGASVRLILASKQKKLKKTLIIVEVPRLLLHSSSSTTSLGPGGADVGVRGAGERGGAATGGAAAGGEGGEPGGGGAVDAARRHPRLPLHRLAPPIPQLNIAHTPPQKRLYSSVHNGE